MSVILKRPWTRQPQYVAQADKSHPVAGLLDTLVNFNGPQGLRNLLQPDKPVTHSVSGFGHRPPGTGLVGNFSGFINLGLVGNYTAGSFFHVMRLTPDNLGGGPVGIFKGPFSSVGYYAHFQGDIVFISGSAQTGTPAGVLVVGKTSTVVITVDVGVAAGCRIWVDGVDVTSGGGGTHSPTSSSNNLSLLAYSESSNQLAAAVYAFGCGNRKLPQSAAKWLSTGENIWQLFEPLPRRIWAPAAGASGAIAGAADLVFAAGSSTLTGAGALAGTAAIAITPTGTLDGAGALVGTAAAVITPTGTVVGAGALAGSSALTFDATLTTSTGDTSGSAALSLSATGTLTGAGALAGLAALTFGATSTPVRQESDFSGGWAGVMVPRRRTKKELRDERIALGILPPDVIEELPATVAKKARKAGTITLGDLLGKPAVAEMSAIDMEFALQRIKRKKRRQQEEMLLLM